MATVYCHDIRILRKEIIELIKELPYDDKYMVEKLDTFTNRYIHGCRLRRNETRLRLFKQAEMVHGADLPPNGLTVPEEMTRDRILFETKNQLNLDMCFGMGHDMKIVYGKIKQCVVDELDRLNKSVVVERPGVTFMQVFVKPAAFALTEVRPSNADSWMPQELAAQEQAAAAVAESNTFDSSKGPMPSPPYSLHLSLSDDSAFAGVPGIAAESQPSLQANTDYSSDVDGDNQTVPDDEDESYDEDNPASMFDDDAQNPTDADSEDDASGDEQSQRVPDSSDDDTGSPINISTLEMSDGVFKMAREAFTEGYNRAVRLALASGMEMVKEAK